MLFNATARLAGPASPPCRSKQRKDAIGESLSLDQKSVTPGLRPISTLVPMALVASGDFIDHGSRRVNKGFLMSLPLTGRSTELRATILRFLQERRDGKLENLPVDDPQRQSLIAQFEFKTWIDDAARRVGQIQAVTHQLRNNRIRCWS